MTSSFSYKVTYARDSLDPNPTVKEFNFEEEAQDWIHEEVARRVSFIMEHNPLPLSDGELESLEEIEYSMINITKLFLTKEDI
tara:strand:+ start:849 stop:1097 length:249 start_codon:yes stop_codon:yes gene_type:complete